MRGLAHVPVRTIRDLFWIMFIVGFSLWTLNYRRQIRVQRIYREEATEQIVLRQEAARGWAAADERASRLGGQDRGLVAASSTNYRWKGSYGEAPRRPRPPSSHLRLRRPSPQRAWSARRRLLPPLVCQRLPFDRIKYVRRFDAILLAKFLELLHELAVASVGGHLCEELRVPLASFRIGSIGPMFDRPAHGQTGRKRKQPQFANSEAKHSVTSRRTSLAVF